MMTLMLEPWSFEWWMWVVLGTSCLATGLLLSLAYLRSPKQPPAGLTSYNVFRSPTFNLVVRSPLTDEEVLSTLFKTSLRVAGMKRGRFITFQRLMRSETKKALQALTPHKVVVELA